MQMDMRDGGGLRACIRGSAFSPCSDGEMAVYAADPVPVLSKALGQLVLYPEPSALATVVSLNDSRIAAEVEARVAERGGRAKVLEIDKQGRIRLSMKAVNSSISSR